MKLSFRTAFAVPPALCALLLAGGAAGTQRQVDPECRDDNGVDRCAAEQQRRTRDLFGVRSIEEHREAGDEVRRVFYVDGYGRDLVAIAFVRAPGREPMVYVHFPRREGEQRREPLQAAVPQPVWEELRRRSALFDRELVPVPQQEPSICLHSWVYTVEANEPARANLARARLRRTTEDACEDGPAARFASDVQTAALALFPHCSRLDPELHRNPASQLAACRLLAGDRMAAAEVLNRWNAFGRARRDEDRRLLDGLFAHRTVIEWRSERIEAEGPQAGDQWLRRLVAEGGPGFYVESVEGLSADRVRFRGHLSRSVDQTAEARSSRYQAPVEMIWVFGPGQDWQVASVTVGAWQRIPSR